MLKPRPAFAAAATVWLALVTLSAQAPQPATPPVTEGDFIVRNYTFASGEMMPEVTLHYRTLGIGHGAWTAA